MIAWITLALLATVCCGLGADIVSYWRHRDEWWAGTAFDEARLTRPKRFSIVTRFRRRNIRVDRWTAGTGGVCPTGECVDTDPSDVC